MFPAPEIGCREQVELYESSGGTRGTTLLDTGVPVIIVTHTGNKTGAIRKTSTAAIFDS
jgi:F420H(2)-dependent quinone reductase